MTRGGAAAGPLVIAYTDGASRGNPGPAAVGVVLYDRSGTKLREFGKLLGVATNNEAEYTAVLEGLTAAAGFTAGWVELRSDSQVVVRQLAGTYATRKPELLALQKRVREAAEAFTKVNFRNVPRSHPGAQRADRLANRALDLQERAAR